MKKLILLKLIITISFFFSFKAKAQFEYYPFNGGPYLVYECADIWAGAGCDIYNDYRNPYVVNAITDVGLNGIGVVNSTKINSFMIDFKSNHPDELLLIYFPAGEYAFNAPIDIINMHNVILKGESAWTTSILFEHTKVGININNAFYIGIEDLKIQRMREGTSGNGSHGILFTNTTNSWVSGVYSHNAHKSHISMNGGRTGSSVNNINISGCTFNGALARGDGGEGYGVNFNGAFQCLLENSIFTGLRHAVTFQQDAFFNVMAYNASYNPYNETFADQTVWVHADVSFHGRFNADPGPHHNLVEGNRVEMVRFDWSHGSNGPYNTCFRNDIKQKIQIYDADGHPDYDGDGENSYAFSNTFQNAQNAIACSGLSWQDEWDGEGTVEFCGELCMEEFYCTPEGLDDKYSTYFTRGAIPAYFNGANRWPYEPPNSINAAESRKRRLEEGDFGPTSVYPEGWNKYPCGIPYYLRLGDNRDLSDASYAGIKTIDASACRVRNTRPVEFIARESITLGSGFSTEPGANLTVSIGDPCPANRSLVSSGSDDANSVYVSQITNKNIATVNKKIKPQPLIINKPIVESQVAQKNNATPYKGTNTIQKELNITTLNYKNELTGIYPNPFTDELKLHFSLKENQDVQVILYNHLMQVITSTIQNYNAGKHELTQLTTGLPNGFYILTFKAGNYFTTEKLVKGN